MWCDIIDFGDVIMFLAMLISRVRKEMHRLGFEVAGDLDVIKVNDNVCLLRLENESESYLIRYYENGQLEEEVSRRLKLEKFGIKTGVLHYSNRMIICSDYQLSWFYRIASEADLSSELFVRNLARWYKNLHSIKSLGFKRYEDYFTVSNVKLVVDKYNLKGNAFFEYILNNFDNIKLKLSRLENNVICSGFSLENVAVSKETGKIIVTELTDLCEGNREVDIAFALSIIDEKLHWAFKEEYGDVSKDEIIINEIVGCIVDLYLANLNNRFDERVKMCLRMINNEILLEKVKTLVEWY